MISLTECGENFKDHIVSVTQSWKKIESNLDMYRDKITESFQSFPFRTGFEVVLENEEKEVQDKAAAEVKKKLSKHSAAILNWMEIVVDFLNGNEETKPILYLLGRQHQQASVNEKMFLELRESICKVIEQSIGQENSRSWKLIFEYIYVTYIFPGMGMVETI